ncbi:MAG: HD-GYP domain-containing protein [Armatimonadota bacterium]|nr:HD-GYP domain-containing protein [Armatimonadota bacterium]MDR7519253.1 HD-GYP domain-containing protein [Armatimonadota bacterium]MDR7550904.1 HD-GYP domain-containing protein [Armatimonadota bacterium]
MMHRRKAELAEVGLLLVGGGSLGFGLAGLDETNLVRFTVIVALACVAEWLEVRFGPFEGLTLRPVVAFIGLWGGGSAILMLAGLLPIAFVGIPLKRSSPRHVLAQLGRDALALWFGFLVYQNFVNSTVWPMPSMLTREVAARVSSILAFWTLLIPLQAFGLGLTEGMHFRSALQHLLRHAWPHATILTLVAVMLSYLDAGFGIMVMGIAVVMLVEAYYPWKLLGEQRGVLTTSLQMMAQAVDLKDPYTSNHSRRVSEYAVRLARAMGLPEVEVERIRIGALMHDIGKIGISGRIIRKPGKLTDEEQVIMQGHPLVSASIIEPLEILGESAEMVRHHHENWDGTGYPDGLKGEEIPLGSRIIFVADALDALLTDRPYRKGASRAEALAIIRRNAGTQFDPSVVEALARIADLL